MPKTSVPLNHLSSARQDSQAADDARLGDRRKGERSNVGLGCVAIVHLQRGALGRGLFLKID